MPATDQYFRKLSTMHVVFAISSLALLASTIWMMAIDHIDEWRVYQKTFFTVEAAKLRAGKSSIDTPEYRSQVKSLEEELGQQEALLGEGEVDISGLRVAVGDLEEQVGLLNREVRGIRAQRDVARANFGLGVRDKLSEKGLANLKNTFSVWQQRVDSLELELEKKEKGELKEAVENLKKATAKRDAVAGKLKEQQSNLERMQSTLVKIAPETPLSKFKRAIMEWPIIDGFNSHLKITNDWLPNLHITLGMAKTARFDRCRTCHLGIDRVLAGNVPEFPFGETKSSKPEDWVQAGKYPQPFATHPRTDVFLTASSPHPINKFGCTSCHAGQGSGTSFTNAAHTPNNPHQDHDWHTEHNYASNHFWEYPMYPQRFRETSCLKCHHQVIELGINKQYGPTAPKLYKGWQLITKYGCFGCHEFRGFDGGNPIGPDLRLEPNYSETALQLLSMLQSYRSVAGNSTSPKSASGVSLAEIRKLALGVVNHPSSSGPDRVQLMELLDGDKEAKSKARNKLASEKLSTNEKAKAVQELNGKYLPSELLAVAVGFKEEANAGRMRKVGPSLRHVASKTTAGWIEYWTENPKRFRPTTRMPQFFGLSNQQDPHAQHFTPVEIAGISQYLISKSVPIGLDRPRRGYQPNAKRGETLFSQRGCLACHQNEKFKDKDKTLAASFGPDLSKVHLKIKPGQEGFNWLYTWIRNPQRHHRRTRMPNLFLQPEGQGEKLIDPAADIAAFLLEGGRGNYKPIEVSDVVLDELVGLYLGKVLTKSQVFGDKDADKKGFLETRAYPIPRELIKGDEIELAASQGEKISNEEWKQIKLTYVGRRTISRYGCYGCHDVPDFERARPIGTTLQDWGRKDTSKLALEHIEEYLEAPKIEVLAVEVASADAATTLLKDVHTVDDFYRLANEQDVSGTGGVFAVRLVEGETHSQLGNTDELFELESGSWTTKAHTHADKSFLFLVENKIESTTKRVIEALKLAKADGFSTKQEQDRELSSAYFYESLLHHGRAGFLWQKLREPRSYDFEKLETKGYDERLRMPKFPFNEEEIEAIATFVLGLVAEPPSEEYVYNPQGPAGDIIEGERLMQKFNCVGCHMIELPEFRYGVQLDEVAATTIKPGDHEEGIELLLKLKPPRDALTGQTAQFGEGEQKKNLPIISFHGITYADPDFEEDPEFQEYAVDLWETLDVDGKVLFPGERMLVPATRLVERKPGRGGKFAEWLAKNLDSSSSDINRSLAWQMSPPPLYHEGIKVQTPWLYQFLKNPVKLRHTTVLRMPRFNLSDREAHALANYFAAYDQAAYPYQDIPEREPPYLSAIDQKYHSEFSDKSNDYLAESWHLLNAPICIKCHSVGGRQVKVGDPKKDIRGPDLEFATARLRPDWTLLWLFNPKWITPYTSMPAVFLKGQNQFPELFDGKPDWQTQAARDALMNYNRLMEREGKYIPPTPAITPAAGEGE